MKIHDKVKPLVEWLNKNGYPTTDSGDGVTNVEAGMEGALPFAHVIIKCPGENLLIHMCNHLYADLPGPYQNWLIEGSYDPASQIAIIMISEPDRDNLTAIHV